MTDSEKNNKNDSSLELIKVKCQACLNVFYIKSIEYTLINRCPFCNTPNKLIPEKDEPTKGTTTTK